MHPNIVILAGGISSRMKKITAAVAQLNPTLRRDAKEKSKAMIGVGENFRPFLDYLLHNIAEAGYRNVIILIGEKDDSIRGYYEEGDGAKQFPSLNISYAVQPIPSGRQKPLGTADALGHALKSMPSWRGQSFTVCNSDNLYSVAALGLMLADTHANAMIDYDRAALQFAPERIAQFAVIKKDAAGFLRNIIEKPSPEEMARMADSNGRVGVSMNIFRLAYDLILPSLETVPLHPVRQEKELPAAVKMLVEQNPHAVFTIPRSEHVPDLTTPSDILPVKEYLQERFRSIQPVMDLFDLTQELIKLPSPTGGEQAVVKFLRQYLEAAGFEVQLQEVNKGRANIYARVGEPELVFSTHTDTVSPELPFGEDETYIYGRGACDAKGIIAAQIKAAEKLRATGVRNFGLLFVVGEESGSDGAVAANTIPNRCRFLIDGEPTGNKLALGSKGALRVEVAARGRAAHSAYPQQGESAISKLLDVLNDIRVLALPMHPLLGETTCNIGTIAGGIQANVIPDFAKAELMLRTVTDVAGIKDLLAQTIAGRAEMHCNFECEPILLEALAGFETTVVAFTTDIPLLTNWGKPLLLGPGSILDAHTPQERIAKTELARAVELYDQIAKKLLDKA